MVIAISGYADKRPLIYPLLKLLQPVGNVLLITDNTNCKRMLENYEETGHFMNVMVAVTPLTSDEVFEDIGYVPADFDFIIVDCKTYYPENVEMHYTVTGEKLDEDEAFHIENMGPANAKFTVSYTNRKQPGSSLIPFNPQLCAYMEQVETYKVLPPTVTDVVIKQLAKDFAFLLNLTEKNLISLQKKGWDS